MDLPALVLTFGTVLLAELPDTTFLATLVLATRYRPLPVWIGVAAAFAVQTAIAVALGTAVTLLPRTPVTAVAACLFLIGAVMLFREAREHQREADAEEEELTEAEETVAARAGPATGLRAVATSFAVLLFAEFGDPSQLLTISLAARFEAPVEVYAGALGALLTVGTLAVLVGRRLLRAVRPHRVYYAGAGVCLLLAVGAAWEIAGATL
ncbi:TMEM165/GDT1 family protein [Nocardiopsis salina]|uniref:TMEM165/GDT1 family protein n=1 Tax=Nocardiopsis salina TaxID=245836 RepID=UPI000347DA18|nr:TMEM165/GDT1 family protein [Nocardiopsis salina]